jgi:hypothetical protein
MAKKNRKAKAVVVGDTEIATIENRELVAPEIAAFMTAPLDAAVTPEQEAALKTLHEEIEKDNAEADREAALDAEVDDKMELAVEHAVENLDADAAKEASDDADVEEDIAKPNSVVKEKFKIKYLEQARAAGIAGKAAKRSNWDWLAREIARLCLNDQHKISIPCFVDILDANGVDHSRWTNRNKGWEGRFRMTGRVALQKVVANKGMLVTKDGVELLAPADWCEKYKTKA